jgi:aminoglycoside phosphotransferase (APT) family kinase protein
MDFESPDQLVHYLKVNGRIASDENPSIQPLPGGVSNRTFFVRRRDAEEWVIKQALPQLRVPTAWFSSPSRNHAEAMALRWLPKLAPPDTIPGLVFEDPENHLLAMRAVPTPHENWKTLLLNGHLKEEHIRQFATLLGHIHRSSSERKTELLPIFQDQSFFESLRLEPYYAFTAGQVPDAAPFLNRLIQETRQHRDCLVHGDYSPKNVLIHEGRLVLLDHEVIHFGEPAFDLGFSLTHLLSKAHYLQAHRKSFVSAAHLAWRSYLQAVAPFHQTADFQSRVARHTLACLLARVAGRSTLEYFNADHRRAQQEAVLQLLRGGPEDVTELIDSFVSQLPT